MMKVERRTEEKKIEEQLLKKLLNTAPYRYPFIAHLVPFNASFDAVGAVTCDATLSLVKMTCRGQFPH